MAIDREGNATATGFTLTLDTSAQYGELITYSPIEFGAQDNADAGGCFDIADQPSPGLYLNKFGRLDIASDFAFYCNPAGIDISFWGYPDLCYAINVSLWLN